MLAIISDIHSNLEALSAVLDDIAARGITRIICLGDTLGYGPNPKECLDLVIKNVELSLLGNHDSAVLFEPHRFNMHAEAACFWTRRQLEQEPDRQASNARWDFLGGLRVKEVIDGENMGLGHVTFVHGSPRRPVNEYIFPDDIFSSPAKVQGLFERFEHICFVGHTHVPGVFLDTPDFYSPDELEGVFEIRPNRKVLVNVGSVGQPRDQDTRASYAILTPNRIQFIRVRYPVDIVVAKVKAIDELDDYQGTRLTKGR